MATAGIRILDDDGFPWDPSGQLCFHELMGLQVLEPYGPQAAAFEDLVRRGAVLLPSRQRRQERKAEEGIDRRVSFTSLDRMAGDDRYLFFAPARPWHGRKHRHLLPAVVYPLGVLAGLGQIRLRPFDLLEMYKRLTAVHRHGMPWQAWGRRLRAYAECLTLRDPAAITTFLQAWADSFSPMPLEEGGRLRERVRALWPHAEACLQALPHGDSDWVFGDDFSLDPASGIEIESSAYDIAHPGWPFSYHLGLGPGAEILCDAPVPLRAAIWYYDAAGFRWRPMRDLLGT
jgi:hypothetical protein